MAKKVRISKVKEKQTGLHKDFDSAMKWKGTQGDWTQIFPTIPIGLPYEDGLRTAMGVKY